MGKRLLATAVVAAGLSLGLAGTATATPAKATVTAPSTGNSPASVWFRYARFETQGDCEYAGRLLVAGGVYKAWNCRLNGGLWDLWVLD